MLASENLPRWSSFWEVLRNTISKHALSSGSSTRSIATVVIPPLSGGPCATTTTRIPL